MIKKSCYILGHKRLNCENREKIFELLHDKIEELAQDGYTDFIFCGDGDFNKAANSAIFILKHRYSNIKTVYYMADGSKSNKELLQMYDEVAFLTGEEDCGAILQKRAIIDNSDYCIFYVANNSCIKDIINYAENKNKPYINFSKIIE